LSSRPEKLWAFGPPKVMKNGFCSATTLNRSAALPFCHLDRSSEGAEWRDLRSAISFTTATDHSEMTKGGAAPPEREVAEQKPDPRKGVVLSLW
jgi:hypothetical protein